MNIEQIQTSSNWGKEVPRINRNFQNLAVDVEKAKNASTRNKGLFPTEEDLKKAVPTPIVGDWAVVGNTIPGTVYQCKTAGTWTNTGQQGGGGEVDLTGYTKETDFTPFKEQTETDITSIKQTQTSQGKSIDTLSTEQTNQGNKLTDLDARTGYVACKTAAGTAAKTVTKTGFVLSTGCRLVIKMSYANTAASPTLNVNNTGAKPFYYNGEVASSNNTWEAGETLDVYYDGTIYQASSFEGGGVNAEKIKFDNSDTEIKSNNAQGAIKESYAQGISNRKAIFNIDISQEFNFKDGNYITDLGILGGNSNLSYCDYVDISSYSYLYISLVSLASNNTIKASIAFYDENKTFISSYTPDNTPDRTLDATAIAVPTNARYLRTCKWVQSIMDEYQFTFTAKACMNLSILSSEIDNIYELLKKEIDISNEVTISRNSSLAFINCDNGSRTGSSTFKCSENYINITGVKSIRCIVGFNKIYKNIGYAFYDSGKKFISGGYALGEDSMDDIGEEEVLINNIPSSAKFFRFTIKDTVSIFVKKYTSDIEEADTVNLTDRAIFTVGSMDVTTGGSTNVGANTSYINFGYINISGFYKILSTLYVTTVSACNAGIIFLNKEFNIISSVRCEISTYVGHKEVTVNVPSDAVYYINTIDDPSSFTLIGYKSNNTEDGDEQVNETSNYNLRLPRIDVKSPSISVNGDELGLSMDKTPVSCTIKCSFKDIRIYDEFGEIAYQGASSLAMPKKGFTLTFSKKHRFKNWIEMDEYHCKGYYSDWLHCRDLIANKILEQVILTRPQNSRRSYQFNNKFSNNDIELLTDSGALCHVDGFPVELYINDSYWGLYSLNIKKERDNYKLDKNNTDHIQIEASSDVSYGNASSFNWGGVEIRCPKSDSGNSEFIENATPKDGEVKTAWIDFINKLNAINDSDTTKEDLKYFLNIEDWIDNILLCWFFNHTDNWSKNTLYTTWDGTHWSPLLYDMDNTFGIVDITGGSAKPYNYDTFGHKAYSNCPWLSKIENILSNEIKSRYAELRKNGIFTADNVESLITAWVKEVGLDVYKDDTARWIYPGLGNGGSFVDSQYRMVQWIKDRLGYLDEKYVYVE